ncbi:MAG: SCO family protein [Oceanicaulis sp.]
MIATLLALAALSAANPEIDTSPLPGDRLPSGRVQTLDGPLDLLSLRGRPVALAPVYFTCPTVCGLTEQRLARSFLEAGLTPGEDAALVFLSFDPRDDEATADAAYQRVQSAAPDGAAEGAVMAWGGDAEAVLDALGYGRRFDPASEEFAHPAALAVLTPDGEVSRWLGPQGLSADQLRRALTEASNGSIGGVLERALLLCWRFDPETGVYTPRILLILQIAGALTVLLLGGYVLGQLRRRS